MVRQKLFVVTTLATLALTLVSPFVFRTSAAELVDRSLVIASSVPSEATDHLYSFDYISASNVGSVAFEYCANTAILDDVCIAPSGLDVSGVALAFQAGETGFGVHPSTSNNRIVLSRPSVAVTPGSAQYLFENSVNHDQENTTVYVRIYTYGSIDATGAYTDAGAVAFSTASQLTVGGFVPPFLLFCVGVTVAIDCSTANGTFIPLGELQPTLPSVATSQYAGATNDFTGYDVSVYGPTMTSGSNTIPALATPTGSVTGTSQFGINLRDNGAPDVGIEPIGPGTAVVSANYNVPNAYTFNSGDTLSSVATSSSYDRFTVSYMVNVSDAQPAGIYVTTLTYVAVASF